MPGSLRGWCSLCAQQIRLHVRGRVVADTDFWEALGWIEQYVQSARPRTVKLIHYEAPTLLFTDGAVEGAEYDRVTCGAVLYSPRHKDPLVFGVKVPESVVYSWTAGVPTQVIAEAELLPVLLAFKAWPELLCDSELITFVDNEGAKYSLMKGYSPVLTCARLTSEIWMAIAQLGVSVWFDRVPTPSNVADKPSRLDFSDFPPSSIKVYQFWEPSSF